MGIMKKVKNMDGATKTITAILAILAIVWGWAIAWAEVKNQVAGNEERLVKIEEEYEETRDKEVLRALNQAQIDSEKTILMQKQQTMLESYDYFIKDLQRRMNK